jgi:hypothetical protein
MSAHGEKADAGIGCRPNRGKTASSPKRPLPVHWWCCASIRGPGIQNRRELGLVILGTFVSGCDNLVRVEQKPRLRGIRISLPPEETAQLLLKLELFAQRHGFAFSSDRVSSTTGTSTHFSLRREDIRIEGLNPLKDEFEIRTLPDGTPEASMEIDEGRFEVGFFAVATQPPETDLDALVLDFIATVRTVESATATERPNEIQD